MSERSFGERVIPLTERPVPPMVEAQIAEFTPESIQATSEGNFEVQLTEGHQALGIDIGGDSLQAAVVSVQGGQANTWHNVVNVRGSHAGAGYLDRLVWAANYSNQYAMPVGIAFCGPVDGTSPVHGENVGVLMAELAEQYGGDFANLFPQLVSLRNDAVAGLIAGLARAQGEQQPKNVIYLLNGSGLNAAISVDGQIFSMEAGHVPVVDALNPLGQQDRCQLHDEQFVCVEAVAASKAGIESLWAQQTGEALDGRAIEAKYKEGNQLAADLYDNSAVVAAHMAIGAGKALGIDFESDTTAIVGHGGGFKFPGYGERVKQVIETYTGFEIPLLMTQNFSKNACLDGAGIAALTKVAHEL